LPERWAAPVRENLEHSPPPAPEKTIVELDLTAEAPPASDSAESPPPQESKTSTFPAWPAQLRELASAASLWLTAFFLAWILYANLFLLFRQTFRGFPLPDGPYALLEPLRVANPYGLFGRMTWKRYEIEFQGSNDGTNWTPYPFRNKPQNPAEAPRIYAPYQPRFDWNLWFASLGEWRGNPWVVRTEELLLSNNPQVLSLFAANPFPQAPPTQIRAVLWQYFFTDRAAKRATGMWWRREFLGLYAPALERAPDGKFLVTAWPDSQPPPP
jgi:lipase maturation factor 1